MTLRASEAPSGHCYGNFKNTTHVAKRVCKNLLLCTQIVDTIKMSLSIQYVKQTIEILDRERLENLGICSYWLFVVM